MWERYTFYFAYRATGIVRLLCRLDSGCKNHRSVRRWYGCTQGTYAGIDLSKFCENYENIAHAALHFGLHLIDRDLIDCKSLTYIQYRTDKWLHISECEEMGNVDIMCELDCKIYPVAIYVVERSDPYAGN